MSSVKMLHNLLAMFAAFLRFIRVHEPLELVRCDCWYALLLAFAYKPAQELRELFRIIIMRSAKEIVYSVTLSVPLDRLRCGADVILLRLQRFLIGFIGVRNPEWYALPFNHLKLSVSP